MEKLKRVIDHYISAKDQNKPQLMRKCFTESAFLEMEVNTAGIVFPDKTQGLDAITDLLVNNFHQRFEQISTFCATDSVSVESGILQCRWFVVMTEKANQTIKVGCGTYYWHFNLEEHLLVTNLKIIIDEMATLSNDHSTQLQGWTSTLSYPWCDAQDALSGMPNIEGLDWLRNQLK